MDRRRGHVEGDLGVVVFEEVGQLGVVLAHRCEQRYRVRRQLQGRAARIKGELRTVVVAAAPSAPAAAPAAAAPAKSETPA